MAIGPLPDALEPDFHCVTVHTGRLPDALNPGFHCARTHWIRGFMAFQTRDCGRSPFPRPAPQCYSRVTKYRRRH